uniref:RIIa domain-containing protein n=1 Tax=Mesocestoides corti TaxID=53468 RepID=A0A5K3FER4_MESCO
MPSAKPNTPSSSPLSWESTLASSANNKSVVRRLRAQRDLKDLRVETEVCADGVLTKFERIYDLRDVELFLANGAVLVMQRVYAITGAQSRVTLNTLDIDGTLCCLACEFLGGKDANCDSTSMSEVAVEQTLCSPTGHSITTQKYFTTYGQLVSVVQIGSPVVFKLAQPPLPIIKEDDFFWRDNMYMLSKFYQRKEELISQYHLYLYDHPEFTDLLKDFLQALLMEKPEDTYNFAADYFTSFSKRREETTCLKQA